MRISTVADGDFHLDTVPSAVRAHRRQSFAPGAWTQLDEVHGTDVLEVRHPGEHDGAVGDAAFTRSAGAVLSVWVGDCAPVALLGDDGVVAVAHAGWRGALDGVLQRTVESMGARRVHAVLGPCIHGCCNEFGSDLLAEFAARYGLAVAATTTWGTPSLHLPNLVHAALAEVGVALDDRSQCTRCSSQWFSHRRGDAGRQVMTVRMMKAR